MTRMLIKMCFFRKTILIKDKLILNLFYTYCYLHYIDI